MSRMFTDTNKNLKEMNTKTNNRRALQLILQQCHRTHQHRQLIIINQLHHIFIKNNNNNMAIIPNNNMIAKISMKPEQ